MAATPKSDTPSDAQASTPTSIRKTAFKKYGAGESQSIEILGQPSAPTPPATPHK